MSSPSFLRSIAAPVTAAVASIALLGIVVPGAVANPLVERAAKPDTLFPTQGNPGYDVLHYDVRLNYKPVANTLQARTAIRAVAKKKLTSFHLDFSGMTVRSVRVDGTKASWHRKGHELVVKPAKPVTKRFTTVVTYGGNPDQYTDTDGSSEGWVRTKDGAIALGEPVGAMTWLPSNNTPGDKARYTFRITVPDSVKAVANGDLVSRKDHGARSTWTWQVRDRMATYLATIAIGRFDVYRSSVTSVDGRKIPIWSFIDPETDDSAAARKALPKVLRFQEKLFGPYPFTSTGMIVDDANVGYALETQTRPFYPFSVDGDTLVHEMAHQWYGDSVGFRDWHDIWLAEGFATYAEWLWGAAHGEASPAERFDDLYATPANNALWNPAPTTFTDSADLFGEPVYTRGAMTLQALRERVGDKDFFKIIKSWATSRRQSAVTTPQFVAHAEKVSGEELSSFFADWLRLDSKPTGY